MSESRHVFFKNRCVQCDRPDAAVRLLERTKGGAPAARCGGNDSHPEGCSGLPGVDRNLDGMVNATIRAQVQGYL